MTAKRDPRLPNCLVIGPQKAGTSWIAQYFESRSDVALPQGVKETFYFDRRYHSKSLEWYAVHFSHRQPQHRLAIEVAPTYFHHPEVPARVRDTLGDLKLVCTLRDPVRRAYSLYLHMLRYGITRKPLRQAVEQHPEILDSSRYARCLERWFEVFGRSSMLVLDQQQLSSGPDSFVFDLCDHIGLPYIAIPDHLHCRVNEAAAPRHFVVAAAGRLAGDALRSFRLYAIVEFAKRCGLKNLFFGKPYGAAQPKLAADDEAWLGEQLQGEIEAVENLLERRFPAWKLPVTGDVDQESAAANIPSATAHSS